MTEVVVFLIVGAIAILSAAFMLISRNAVHSVVFLVLNFLCVAFLFLTLSAPFIALVQVTVYAGAIMVLFLFVIMLLGAEQLGSEAALPWQRPLAFILGGILLFEAAYAIFTRVTGAAGPTELPATYGSPAEIGALLFSKYLLPFEVISVLLLAAMVGAIVLTRKHNRAG